MTRLITSRKGRIGVAIEASRIVAIRLDEAEKAREKEGPKDIEGRLREFVVDLPKPLEPTPEGVACYLESAFRSICEALNLSPEGTVADLALLPPLFSLRILRLPPVAGEDLRRVLSRDARRYFGSPWERPVVGVCRLEDQQDGRAPVLAAAAPNRLVAALFEAGTAVGWGIRTVVPAQSVWASAIRGDQLGTGDDGTLRQGSLLTVVVLREETTEILQTCDGRLVGARRLPPEWSPERLARFVAEIKHDEGSIPTADDAITDREGEQKSLPPVAVLGAKAARSSIAEALTAHGVDVLDSNDPETLESPARLAAGFARYVTAPRLIPAEVRAAIRRRSRRAALALVGGGALLLVLAALVELWGLHREVDAVADHRASLVPEVRVALGRGDSLVSDIERLVTLGELEHEASRLSLALPEVTKHLPKSSYLKSFTARADTLLLTGAAERAAVVFEGLQKSQGIEAVQAEGPIRRDEAEAGVMRESFTLSARIGNRVP